MIRRSKKTGARSQNRIDCYSKCHSKFRKRVDSKKYTHRFGGEPGLTPLFPEQYIIGGGVVKGGKVLVGPTVNVVKKYKKYWVTTLFVGTVGRGKVAMQVKGRVPPAIHLTKKVLLKKYRKYKVMIAPFIASENEKENECDKQHNEKRFEVTTLEEE